MAIPYTPMMSDFTDAERQAARQAAQRRISQANTNGYWMGGTADQEAESDLAQQLAKRQEEFSRKRYQDTTYGVGDQLLNDPRIEAAMAQLTKASDPAAMQAGLYSQATDATAAQAAAKADMLRQQMGRLGFGPDDPAMASQLRAIETGRMQDNNAALTQSQLAAQSQAQQAAATAAQMRLSQYGAAQNYYSAGNRYDAGQRFGATYQAPQLRMGGGKGGQGTADDWSPWAPPAADGTTQNRATPASAATSTAPATAPEAGSTKAYPVAQVASAERTVQNRLAPFAGNGWFNFGTPAPAAPAAAAPASRGNTRGTPRIRPDMNGY